MGGRIVDLVVSAVRIVCLFLALVLVAQIVFVMFAANPDKWITRFVADLSGKVTLGLDRLFVPADPSLAVLVNYGIPALAWLLIGVVVARILRAVAGRRRR